MNSSKRVLFRDFTFFVGDNVYEPAEDSFLFAESLPIERSCRVVDVGTGCGILAIVAARNAEHVLAIDLNPFAVRCASQNARFNGVIDRMDFVEGDLLGSVRDCSKFDLMLFNAPYLPVQDKDGSWLERSWTGGKSGRDVIDRFINEVFGYLNVGGQILLMQSSLSDVDKTLQRFSNQGLHARVVASRSLPFFEKIVLISATSSKG
jgi:release factor glutamine methyltransferase